MKNNESVVAIGYFKAMKMLQDRLHATPHELAAWIFTDELLAYCDEEISPETIVMLQGLPSELGLDYEIRLERCYFSLQEIESFKPAERYVTGAALLERLEKHPRVRSPMDLIDGKVAESKLLPFHPISGLTQFQFPGDECMAPKGMSLFSVSKIEQMLRDTGLVDDGALEPPATVATPADDAAAAKPWLERHRGDPEPEQPWYTPARYFARELIKSDSTLLLKMPVLAGKVSASLAKVGFFKRGGKFAFAPGTVLKALSNVSLG